MYIFLILSLLSGIIELGAIYLGISQELTLHQIMLLPLFYQVGNIMMSLVPTKKLLNTIVIGILSLLTLAYHLFPSFEILLLQIVCCSYCIQFSRLYYKHSCPAWLKRTFRIGGFMLSPIMIFGNGQGIIALCILLCSVLKFKKDTNKGYNQKLINSTPKKKIEISGVMVFHQLHYFVYSYIMPIYIYRLTNSIVLSAITFSATWVTYLIPEIIATKVKAINYVRVFYCCHVFLGLCMAVIAVGMYFNMPTIILVAWILTGIGGGSVFCIGHLCNNYKAITMELSENIGHFFGPLIAVILCYITKEYSNVFLPIASFLFVVIAIINSLFVTRKEV